MKNRIVALMLCFLLAACGKVETPPTDPTVPSLAGVWVNAGQYSEGHDFVETMTLAADGSVTVRLEYQGADYACLTGSWMEADGVLYVDFADPGTKDRSYSFTVTDTTLTLTGDGKAVEYRRS
ncbi:MAG: hypothetical protein IIY94_05240 [Oscillospiraceae bacterium]|nr:hypothetical protein [Oscillospiraceae bacterium]